ncbi:hypothetical protein A3E15_01300 [Candidatus Woesebacteria bacterium RIFCSPHIGHO2_12_FULL_42_9]|uniref:Dephospho-CoA kinase n=2 Tax=Candidatus Woeseibacteriota TaxID=1752722 RepID=A0A1F8AS73_9BACT|nr:MAG: hypothetical protein A2112_00160 [Candidatus Woesebacteria bacterium GWA1_42_12]OGM54606.1 MAG: hypothetical protein A3E15_01300 [Candidatus Woesebacteria bacterium RIFCSPHIGHO2_12_FULL_42_9]
MIIGITGTLGAGKGTIASYLVKEKGFKHFSVREFLNKELQKRKLRLNRDNLVLVGNELRKKYGPSYISESLYKLARKVGYDSVIESLRTPAEILALKKRAEFYLFAVDADPKLRYQRTILIKEEIYQIPFTEFIRNEKREMDSKDPNKQNLRKCIEMADYRFENSGEMKNLYKSVDEALKKIKKNK